MSKDQRWRDPRKNIYTLTITNRRHGYITHIETHSNKKKAEERLSRLTQLYVVQKDGGPDGGVYNVEMYTTKLQRKSQWD